MIFVICQHELATGAHVSPILKPPLTSLSISSLWVVSQYLASCIELNIGHLFYIWYYTCFSATLSSHLTLAFSQRVQKSVLYICVSFVALYIRLSLPAF